MREERVATIREERPATKKGRETGNEKGRMAQCDANEDKRKLLGILSVRGP